MSTEDLAPRNRETPVPWKRLLATALACTLVMLAGFHGSRQTLAFFTDQDQKTNRFVYGKVDILPFEPNWVEPEEPGVPNQSWPKDPKIANCGLSDAVVFAEVSVPVAKFALAGEDGRLDLGPGKTATKDTTVEEALQTTEVFWLKTAGTAASEAANRFHTTDSGGNWVLLNTTKGEEGGSTVWLFGYQKILPPSTNADSVNGLFDGKEADRLDSKTEPIFDRIQFRNYVEGTLKGKFEVRVRTYAIQAGSLEDEDGHPLTADCYQGGALKPSAVLSQETLKKIFALYGSQAK